jgi:lipoate-protein ligase A
VPSALGAFTIIDDVDDPASGSDNMSRDAAMLDEVRRGGAPTLRLYQWSRPTLTLGRFQDADEVDHDACERHGVDVVRRPTGGKALLHGGDLTYAVALREPGGPTSTVDGVYRLLARPLVDGLRALGVTAAVARHDGPAGPVCFATQQGADLRVGDRKVCGSAQVRHGGVVLQHGSILLRRLPFDETDLVHGDLERAQLRAATATLEELGAPSDPRAVADALAQAFAGTGSRARI